MSISKIRVFLPILWGYTDLPVWLGMQRDYSWSEVGLGFLGDAGIFGIIGGGATGSLIGTAMAGHIGAAIGGATGSATGYLTDIVSKIGADWKPVIFGNWLRQRIEKFTKET